MQSKKILKTLPAGHNYPKSSDCSVCPVSEKERRPDSKCYLNYPMSY